MREGEHQGDTYAHATNSPDQSAHHVVHDPPAVHESGTLLPDCGLVGGRGDDPHRPVRSRADRRNIEPIDFELKADLVGISAMTSYVKRGYEIADAFRERGIPVIMGGVHPSFMAAEALEHADAVVVGEAELVMPQVLDDLEQGQLRGIYKSDKLHPMVDMPMPRYDLVKKNRYVNRTFIQTSRGCHHGCTFCSEPLMNGLRSATVRWTR